MRKSSVAVLPSSKSNARRRASKPASAAARRGARRAAPVERPDPVLIALFSGISNEDRDCTLRWIEAADRIARSVIAEGLFDMLRDDTCVGVEIEEDGVAMVRDEWSRQGDETSDAISGAIDATTGDADLTKNVVISAGSLDVMLRRCVSAGTFIGAALACGLLRGGAR